MLYELAKELKDAGFPQKEGKYATSWEPPDSAYLPTLEELIEACGERFNVLRSVHNHQGNIIEWVASAESGFDRKAEKLVVHPTPTEAVARLWLALNKKV
jgi:hypothetical protein